MEVEVWSGALKGAMAPGDEAGWVLAGGVGDLSGCGGSTLKNASAVSSRLCPTFSHTLTLRHTPSFIFYVPSACFLTLYVLYLPLWCALYQHSASSWAKTKTVWFYQATPCRAHCNPLCTEEDQDHWKHSFEFWLFFPPSQLWLLSQNSHNSEKNNVRNLKKK